MIHTELGAYIAEFEKHNAQVPVYLYDADKAISALSSVLFMLQKKLEKYPTYIFLPIFANPCFPFLDKLLSNAKNVGILVNTIPELKAVVKYPWYKKPRVAFAGSLLSDSSIQEVVYSCDIYYASSLKNFKKAYKFSNRKAELGLRVSLSQAANSPGVTLSELELETLDTKKLINSIHAYQGPDITSFETCLLHNQALVSLASSFPNLKEINFSGGLPFDYSQVHSKLPQENEDFSNFLEGLLVALIDSCLSSDVRIVFEPGKFLLAPYGYFLCKVVDVVHSGLYQADIHVSASFANIPALKIKNRQHPVRVTNLQPNNTGEMLKKNISARLRGCTGLSTDYLMPGYILIPYVQAGDWLIIHNVGVYGWAGSYNFLGIQRASEWIIYQNNLRIAREVQPELHLLDRITITNNI